MIAYNTIRELREERQWSQEQMAELLQMSKNGYAKIERGESKPSLERLEQIARVFDVSILDLLQTIDKQVVLQTQNQQANYYQHYINNESLQSEIEKLKLIIAHKDEIIQQKEEYIQVLKKMANINTNSEVIEV